jgi:hypothetical protein
MLEAHSQPYYEQASKERWIHSRSLKKEAQAPLTFFFLLGNPARVLDSRPAAC